MPIDPFSIALGVGGIASNIINNKQQLDFAEKNYQFQRYQYEDMKKYNSAAEQVKRLRAAGMNPAFTFGQNAGMAQAASSPSAPATSPLDMNGLASIGQGINLNQAQARNLEADTAKTKVQTEGENIDLLFRHQKNLVDLYHKNSDSWYKDMLSRNIKLNNMYLDKTMISRIRLSEMQVQSEQAHAYSQYYLLPYVPLKAQAEIENLAANTKLALDSGAATLKQAMAALTQAEVAKNAIEAQYGDSKAARKRWNDQCFKYLTQQISTSESQEFKNYSYEQNSAVPGRRAQYNKKTHSWHEQDVRDRKPIFRFGEW